jgi:hypothetical protein
LNVGEDLLRCSIALKRGREGGTHGSAGGSRNQGGDDAIARVIVQAADQLQLRAVSQPDPTDDVELPQLHRGLALPTAEVAAASPAPAQLNQVMADQDAVDPGPRRNWRQPAPLELVLESQQPPARMLAAQLTDRRLNLRRRLVRTRLWAMGAVFHAGQPFGLILQPEIVT